MFDTLDLDWTIVLGEPYRSLFIDGLIAALKLVAVSLVSAFVIGIPIGLMRLKAGIAGRVAFWYVEFLRSTPPLIHVLLWFFGASVIFPAEVYSWLLDHNLRFWAVAIALSIYYSAFIAEVVRSGIGAIPGGQFEAARALGLSRRQSRTFVIFPQVIRIITPASLNEVVSLVKNTSLGVAIGLQEIMFAGRIVNDYTFRPVEAYVTVAAIYLALVFSITTLATLFTKRFEAVGLDS